MQNSRQPDESRASFVKLGRRYVPDKSSKHAPCAVRKSSRYGTRSVPTTIKTGKSARPTLTMAAALMIVGVLGPTNASAVERLLPDGIQYNKSVPSPAKFLGFDWGARHLYHHELVRYCEKLAETSPRVQLSTYEHTYGGKPLLAVSISSPANLKRLTAIRKAHRQLADPTTPIPKNLESLPLCMWMCYGVHGNEASATNISVWVAYHLAASNNEETLRWLDETVIRLDPSLNPDGFERFAHWTNNHKGLFPSEEPEDREHSEDWPSGRTNYYWFDLNRDWLPMRHPESRGRIKAYHQWKPNVVLDFHEMGSHSTYFFQPGVPARNNPLTPSRVFELTSEIAEYHAKALDDRGALFYTQERFDDFYMGKGSTYPDLHGGIGILFEQASARGIQQQTRHGKLSFRDALQNQFATSLSSLRAAVNLRQELLMWKAEFYQTALDEARDDKVKAYVVSSPNDPARLTEFRKLLTAHDIRTTTLKEDITVGKKTFDVESSLVVPTEQPEYRFVRSLFERRTSFAENIFYDVSTWTLPLAFGLESAEYTESLDGLLAKKQAAVTKPRLEKPAIAYIIDWQGYRAPRLLNRLLEEDIVVYATPEPITVRTSDGSAAFVPGSLIVPVKNQPHKRRAITAIVGAAVRTDQVRVRSATSSLTDDGPDLGSDKMVRIAKPQMLVVAGSGASAYEAGEVWYVADRQLNMTMTMSSASKLDSLDLNKYNRIVIVSGQHALTPLVRDKLEGWLKVGGTLIVYGGAVNSLESGGLLSKASITRQDLTHAPSPLVNRRPYGTAKTALDLQLMRGAILRTIVDQSHPLGFAMPESLPVFRNQQTLIAPSKNVYANPLVYAPEPVMSGYVSESNRRLLVTSASVVVYPRGSGRIVILAENPNFRAFWLGTERLFYNAIFLPDMISGALSD
jgi:hypothetical protein